MDLLGRGRLLMIQGSELFNKTEQAVAQMGVMYLLLTFLQQGINQPIPTWRTQTSQR